MIYTAEIEDIFPGGTPVDGCGCEGLTVADVAEIGEACLTPGDPSPVGRCPHCDGLVYVATRFKVRVGKPGNSDSREIAAFTTYEAAEGFCDPIRALGLWAAVFQAE